jgi:tRNA dimethylallyltransferase
MPDTSTFNLLTILGPTASGKTRLAVALAHELGSEIISADSRQVFRGMDIGSGKDLIEYGDVPYHLIDIVDSGSEFSVFAFHRHFLGAFSDISGRGLLPLLCGGTGLYLDAALRGYRMVEVPENGALRSGLEALSHEELAAILKQLRPEQHNSSDLLDRVRTVRAIEIASFEREHEGSFEPPPDIRPLVIGIRLERSEVRKRINERLRQRMDNGMIEEVQRLHDAGIPWERLHYYGLEYRYVGAFLRGELSRNEMFQRLNSAIHDFAKRQENWFRKMEKNGVEINWIDGAADPLTEAKEFVKNRSVS